MKHTERNAEKNYVVSMNSQHASKAHLILVQNYRGEEEEACSKRKVSSIMTKLAGDQAVEEQQHEVKKEREATAQSRKLDGEDKLVIELIFKEEINSGKPVYKADIEVMATEHPYLAKLARRLRGVKPIYHHIQYKSKSAFQPSS